MVPVKGIAMLNFIHWVAIHRTDVDSLKNLSKSELINLVYDFAGEYRGDIKKEQWLGTFEMLFEKRIGFLKEYEYVLDELEVTGLSELI